MWRILKNFKQVIIMELEKIRGKQSRNRCSSKLSGCRRGRVLCGLSPQGLFFWAHRVDNHNPRQTFLPVERRGACSSEARWKQLRQRFIKIRKQSKEEERKAVSEKRTPQLKEIQDQLKVITQKWSSLTKLILMEYHQQSSLEPQNKGEGETSGFGLYSEWINFLSAENRQRY